MVCGMPKSSTWQEGPLSDLGAGGEHSAKVSSVGKIGPDAKLLGC